MTPERVVTLSTRRQAATPPATPPEPAPRPAYVIVTAETRAAADVLARRANAIVRALGVSFATQASVAAIPNLIREADAALAELKEVIQ